MPGVLQAEDEGFEPPPVSRDGFQDRCLRPLSQSSSALPAADSYRDLPAHMRSVLFTPAGSCLPQDHRVDDFRILCRGITPGQTASPMPDSNRRPAAYETAALPTELTGQQQVR